MSAHPFARLDPLAASVFSDLLWQFPLTLIVLVVVLIRAFRVERRRRDLTALGRRLLAGLESRRSRVSALAAGDAGLWVLPPLVWALETARAVDRAWFETIHATDVAVFSDLFVAGLALAILITIQSAVVLALRGPRGPRLGVGGGLRVGMRWALVTVVLDGLLVAWLLPSHY